MKKTATIKMKCLICGIEETIKVPVHSFGQLFYIDTPSRHCGVCFTELIQVIDHRGKEEDKNGGKNSGNL